jgi:hypothetical protein
MMVSAPDVTRYREVRCSPYVGSVARMA